MHICMFLGKFLFFLVMKVLFCKIIPKIHLVLPKITARGLMCIYFVASAWEDTPEVEDMTEKEEAK